MTAKLLEVLTVDLGLAGFCAEVKMEYGAATQGHRLALRRAITQHLRLLPEDSAAVLDLATPPHVPGLAISISHCHEVGAFVAGPSTASIGLDIERKERLSGAVLERICEKAADRDALTHLARHGHEGWMWCLKEACIKAAGNAFPGSAPHYAHITTVSIDPQSGFFKARADLEIDRQLRLRGCCFPLSLHDDRDFWGAIAVSENEFDSSF